MALDLELKKLSLKNVFHLSSASPDGETPNGETVDYVGPESDHEAGRDADPDEEDSQDGTYELNEETAQSLIGGSSVISASQSALNSQEPLDREITSDDLKKKHFANQHKIFSLSLPFGGNPLSHFPSFKSFTQGIQIFGGSNDNINDNDYHVTTSKGEIKLKLQRQETISTLEEAYFFHGLKGQGSSRLKAVTNALTPNISLPSFIDDKPQSAWDTIDGDIIILGGYRGSVLRDSKTHRRIWIPLRAGFNMRKIDLLIGPTDEDEARAQKEVYSDNILSHVGPIDISRKLEAKLLQNGKTNVHIFGYDWRLSPDIISEQLYELMQKLKSKRTGANKDKGTLVIAHSMGGLIAHHVMQKDPSLFRGLLYVGVPSECPNTLGPLRSGDRVLMSSKILTAEANFFMRSSFIFLPLGGRCFMNRKTHENYILDYFDVNTWINYNLSPPVSKNRLIAESKSKGSGPASANEPKFSTTFEEAKEYLDRTLKRTKKFLLELEYDESKHYPQLAVVYGNEVPTVRGIRVGDPEGIVRGEYDDFYYGPGDGVVNHKWLMPERRGFPVKARISSDKGHISLLGDLDAMEKALNAIIQTEQHK